MSGRDSVQIPDDRDFGAFRAECESERGWSLTYSKGGVAVWVQLLEPERSLHKIKVRPPSGGTQRLGKGREPGGGGEWRARGMLGDSEGSWGSWREVGTLG